MFGDGDIVQMELDLIRESSARLTCYNVTDEEELGSHRFSQRTQPGATFKIRKVQGPSMGFCWYVNMIHNSDSVTIVRAEPSRHFEAGDAVCIHGLSGKPELNGCHGLVRGWNEKKVRYIVELRGVDKPVAVRASNLEFPLS